MPLKPGNSRKVVSENIKMLMDEGKPRNQAIAISLNYSKKTGNAKVPVRENNPMALKNRSAHMRSR